MIKFGRDKVLLLHQLMIAETGGSADVRDLGLLDSALESAYATFDGKELYPTKEEKAARIGYSLISNHAFVDGNKRIGIYVMFTFLEVNGIRLGIGIYVMFTFLEVNGIRLEATNDEVAAVGLGIALGETSHDDLLEWIKSHKI